MIYNWANENQAAAQAVYDMRAEDTNENLLEPLTLEDFIAELELDGGEEILDGAEQAAFDALVIQNKALPRKANLIGKYFNQKGSSLQVVENGIQVSNPYKQSGVTQVAVVYELTDGQTISVLLHNKDATPKKLAPEDNLIAWRWLLNRKDITIVVAKENGQDQSIQNIARKVMLLAEKNTARFAKANAKREERKAKLIQDEQEIHALEETLKSKVAQIEELKNQIQVAKNQPKNEQPDVVEPESSNVGFSDFEVQATSDTNGNVVFQQSLSDEDADKVAALLNNNDITVIMISRNKTFTVSKRKDGKTLEQAVNEALKGAASGTSEPTVASEEETAPIEVTGKELGDFNTDTPEGKKALREAAFDYLKELAQKGETVFCRALNADVGFSMTGVKKYKKFSADSLKLKIAPKLKQIIEGGQRFKLSHESYDATEKQYGIVYHYLKTPVTIDGTDYGVRIVVREDANGRFHYDAQVKNSVNVIMDSIVDKQMAGSNEVNKAPVPHHLQADNLLNNNAINNPKRSQAIFDDADEEGGWVLNLFLTDADGNPIEDEELPESELPVSTSEPETESNQQEAQDRAYLQEVIAGKVDMMADDFDDKLEAIALRYDGETGEMADLVERAVNAYSDKLDELSADEE